MWFLLLLVFPSLAWGQAKAFPTAEGYGAVATGGRGGAVCYVTNLNNSGADSLRSCLMQTGARTVLFTVSGTIVLSSPIDLTSAHSNLTIAGQSAPGGGIQIKNYPINFQDGFRNAIIRHLRFRVGTDSLVDPGGGSWTGIDGALVWGNTGTGAAGRVGDIIFDHCSFEWATDENLDFAYNASGITVQWSIMAEGYSGSGFGQGPHSMGLNIGRYGQSGDVEQRVTVYGNLFSDNIGRQPRFGVNATVQPNEMLVDVRNNVVYNWGNAQGPLEPNAVLSDEVTPVPLNYHGGSPTFPIARLNIVNNYFKNPSGWEWPGTIGFLMGPQAIYLSGNGTSDFCPNGCDAGDQHWNVAFISCQQTPIVCDVYASPSNFKVTTPFATAAVSTTYPTSQVFATVMQKAGAGAGIGKRDSNDARLIAEAQAGTGVIGPFNDQENVTIGDYPTLDAGTAPTDTDGDGIPDTWETAHSLNPNSAADGAAITGNGYSNLENYLNELAGDGTVPSNGGNANAIYVSVGGHGDTPSDSYTCVQAETITTPFATIGRACQCMTVGGKGMILRQGAYTFTYSNATCPMPGGTVDFPTAVLGNFPSEIATLRVPVGSDDAYLIDITAPLNHFLFKRLVLDGNNESNVHGVSVVGGGKVKFEDVEIKNLVYPGIFLMDTTDFTAKNVYIHDVSLQSGVRVYGSGTQILLDTVTIANTAQEGVDARSGATSINSLTIANSTIRNAGTSGAFAGIGLGPGTGAVVRNTVVESSNHGMHVYSGSQGAKLLNNTVTKSTGTAKGIVCDATASGTIITNNLLAGNVGGDTVENNCGAITLTNLDGENTWFVNYAANNFALADTVGGGANPAINTGTTLPEITIDRLGIMRPFGSFWDVGAYENTTSMPEPTVSITNPLKYLFFY